jgi:hypothetical protein
VLSDKYERFSGTSSPAWLFVGLGLVNGNIALGILRDWAVKERKVKEEY